MNRFNLTEWAIKHRSVVIYFMLVVVIAGGFLSSPSGATEYECCALSVDLRL